MFKKMFVPWNMKDYSVRVPLDYLPPKLEEKQPKALLDLKGVQRALEALSWIGILLATSSFVAFVEVPAGFYEKGLVKVFDPSSDNSSSPAASSSKSPDINHASLRSYFVCNVVTFFLSFATTIFCVTENVPDASPSSANEVFMNILVASSFFCLSIIAGVCTFVSGAMAVYPRKLVKDMIFPIALAGIVLLVVLARHVAHLCYLLRSTGRWRSYLGDHVQVTFPTKKK